MCHDDDVYQQPMEFNPDRHLHFMKNTPDDNKSSASARPDDPTNVVFGFGRRFVTIFPSHITEIYMGSSESVRDCTTPMLLFG